MSQEWARHRDVDLEGAASATDAYIEAHSSASDSIEVSWRVLHSLIDLIPMTAQNAFSGNLAPAFEAEREARTSFTLARIGLYKQALVSLRSVLELGMLSVYWDAHDEAHLDIQRWRAGAERTPSLEAVERRLREVRGVAIYLESDPALFDRIRLESRGVVVFRARGVVTATG